jgi:7-cyano-7-deazaguanine synthase in queuosine biosynthesis
MPEIICGGVKYTPADADSALFLDVHGKDANIELKIQDIEDKLMSSVPPVLLDLLEVASYVYCADQRTNRGPLTLTDMGKAWHKPMKFVIPVRELATWNRADVKEALCSCLRFLSDHSYEFEFVQGGKRSLNTAQNYLELWTGENTAGFTPDEICLFSGGLDSFAGAVEDLVTNKKNLFLVGHYSANKVVSVQKDLIGELRLRGLSKQIFYTPVKIRNVNSDEVDEFTQRTRSFIFACLAVTIAQLYNKDRLTFYENGVVSLNLPLGQDILGARSTRTTHPQTIRGFENIFSLLLNKTITIDHPFQWMTKKEVTALLEKNGYADLIGRTNSCTRQRMREKGKTHCGVCSQCIDRRFGVLAAGLGAHDPQDQYACDLLLGDRGDRDNVVMAVNYVRIAHEFSDITLNQMTTAFPQVFDATPHYNDNDALNKIHKMMQSHARDVVSVIDTAIKENSSKLSSRSSELPPRCLLSMSMTGAKVIPITEHVKDTTDDMKAFMDRLSSQPCEFAMDDKAQTVLFSGGLVLQANEYYLVKHLLPSFTEAKNKREESVPISAAVLAKEFFKEKEPSLRQAIGRINEKVSQRVGVDMGAVIPDFIENVHGQGYRINGAAKLLASAADLTPAVAEAVTS